MANHADVSANPLTPSPDVATIQTSPFPSGADGDAPKPSPANNAAEFQYIPLDHIIPSKTNTRTEYWGPEFDDLVAGIEAHGVLVPVLVRPLRKITFELNGGGKVCVDVPPGPFRAGVIPDAMRDCGISEDDIEGTAIDDSYYELIAGERRYRASLKAGKKDIPARVRDITDVQAVKEQLVENLQRKNLKPLEEARGYIELLDVMAKDQPEVKREDLIKQLAQGVNKAPRTIYGMIQLTKLIPEAQKALEEGRITPSHGDILVRLSPRDQTKAFKSCFRQEYGDGPDDKTVQVALSIREFKREVARKYHLDLATAPWKPDDAALVEKAGPCTICPKRSGNDPLNDNPKNPDICSDGSCYEGKRKAWESLTVLRAYDLAVELHPKEAITNPAPVKLSTEYYSSRKDVHHRNDWCEAKKESCGTVLAGVVIAGPERLGDIFPVCLNKECSTHWVEQAGSTRKQSNPRSSDEQKKDTEKAKREREEKVAGDLAIFTAMLAKVKTFGAIEFDLLFDSILENVYDIRSDIQRAIIEAMGWNFDPDQVEFVDSVQLESKKLPIEKKLRLLIAVATYELIESDFGRLRANDLAKLYKLDPVSIRKRTIESLRAKQQATDAKLQTPAKKSPAKKTEPKGKAKLLTSAQLASIRPEPKTTSTKKSSGKKSPAKKAAKKGARK